MIYDHHRGALQVTTNRTSYNQPEVLLQAYAKAIPHSEEGTFQTQPPSQQYCYPYLDDANRTVCMTGEL